MKVFLKRTMGWLLLVVVFFIVFNVGYYAVKRSERAVAFEVYDAIALSEQKTNYHTLILGDSVARQFFHPDQQEESDEICYMATNQAIMPLGNYILLEKFLENNPQLETVYYAARPDSLESGVDFYYTYSYFVTPFYEENNFQYMEEETRKGIETIFGGFCSKNEFAKWVIAKYPKLQQDYLDLCKTVFQQRRRFDEDYEMPDTSTFYLQEMKMLCERNGIEFHLASVPLPERDDFDFEEWRGRMTEVGMEELFTEYMQGIEYVSQGEFVDGVHLKAEFVAENRERVKHNILQR